MRDRGAAAEAIRPAAEPDSGPGVDLTEDTTCPVCSAAARQERCPRCGWTLFTGYLLGDVTDQDLRAFDERLAEARRRHALGGAALAAGYPRHGDEAMLRRLVRFVPGRPVGEDELRDARQSAGQLADAAAEAWTEAGAVPSPGVLVEVDADGVERTAWEPTADIPAEQAVFSAWSWAQLLPGWPADPDRLAFRLASGHGATLEELDGLRTAAAWVLEGVPATESLFARSRLVGWVVPEALLAAIDQAHPAGRLPPDPAAPARQGRLLLELPDPVTALRAIGSGAAGGPVRLVFGGPSGAIGSLTTGASDTATPSGTHRGRVTAIDADAGGLVVSGGRDGVVMAWDAGRAGELPRPGRQWVVTRHAKWVNAVRVTAGRVYSLGDDGWLSCTELRDDAPADQPPSFAVDVGWDFSRALAVTAEGDVAAVAGTAGRVQLMNGNTGELLRWIDVGAPVIAMAASGTAGTLAVVTHDGVRVHDLRGEPGGTQPLAVAGVSCVETGRGGEVVTGDDAGYVRLFRTPVRRGQSSPAVFAGRHPAGVRAVCVLDDGRIVSADAGGLIRVWPGYRSPKEGGKL